MQSNRYVLIAIILGAVIVSASFFYINRPSIDNQDNDEGTPSPGQEPETMPEQRPEPIPMSMRSTVETLVQDYLSEISSKVQPSEKENIEITVKDYPIELLPASEARVCRCILFFSLQVSAVTRMTATGNQFVRVARYSINVCLKKEICLIPYDYSLTTFLANSSVSS